MKDDSEPIPGLEENVGGPSVSEIVSSAYQQYRENIVEDMKAFASVWILGDLVIYSCPIWMRLPLNHGVSFVWTMILSVMRGDDVEAAAEADEGDVAATGVGEVIAVG